MTEPFVAEIRIFPFNFAPKGWATCDGQLLPLTQNTALFAIVGTMYGGDGKSTFALPDLSRASPMHAGHGSGLSPRPQGELGGTESVTLLQSEMPAHTHVPQVISDTNADSADPSGRLMARSRWNDGQGTTGAIATYGGVGAMTQLSPQALSIAGGSLPHNNMQPYLRLNFCIALQGVFPPRQ